MFQASSSFTYGHTYTTVVGHSRVEMTLDFGLYFVPWVQMDSRVAKVKDVHVEDDERLWL